MLHQSFRRIQSFLIVSFLGLLPHSLGAATTWVNGHTYEAVFTAGLTWNQARDAAAALTMGGQPGYLATFTTRAEQEFVLTELGGGAVLERLWLGAYQDVSAGDYSENYGGWRWITGEPWAGVDPNHATLPRSDFGFNNLYYDGSSEEVAITWWSSGGINDFSNLGYADARGFFVEYNAPGIPDSLGGVWIGLPVFLMALCHRRGTRFVKGNC